MAVLPRLTLIANPRPDEADDVALAEALIRRDPQATLAAWTRLHGLVETTLRRLMGPDGEAGDLSQEVFLRFFASVSKLRDPTALRSFLIGICLRIVRREKRRRWLRRFLRLTETGEPPEIAAPARDGETVEIVRRYYAVVDRLAAEDRSLYLARHLERLPLDEVARLHRMSTSTARRRLLRIAHRVQAMIARDPALASFLGRAKGERTP